MKAIAYMRRSQDSGTGVSEEIQDEAIREYVERKGGTVAYWLPPDLDSSSWTLDRPSMKKALKLLADGKLVVAKLSRVTRRRQDWETLLALMREQGWTIKSADFDVDLSDKGGRLIAGVLIDFLGFEYEEKRDNFDEARRNAVLTHGVHGGDIAPLGYDWTVRGQDKRGHCSARAADPERRRAEGARRVRGQGRGCVLESGRANPRGEVQGCDGEGDLEPCLPRGGALGQVREAERASGARGRRSLPAGESAQDGAVSFLRRPQSAGSATGTSHSAAIVPADAICGLIVQGSKACANPHHKPVSAIDMKL